MNESELDTIWQSIYNNRVLIENYINNINESYILLDSIRTPELEELSSVYEAVEIFSESMQIESVSQLEKAIEKIANTSSAPEKLAKVFKLFSKLITIILAISGGVLAYNAYSSIIDSSPGWLQSMLSNKTIMLSISGIIGAICIILGVIPISVIALNTLFKVFNMITEFIYWLSQTICKYVIRNKYIEPERKRIMIVSMLEDVNIMISKKIKPEELDYLFRAKKYLEDELSFLLS